MVSEGSLVPQQGLVVFAKNKTRVSAFYQQTLELTATESGATHDVLRGHGYEIIVHAIPRKYAKEIKITEPPKPRKDMPIKPTFVVRDLKLVCIAAEKTGGFLTPIEQAWEFRGCTILDGWDPEGNIVQFKQRD